MRTIIYILMVLCTFWLCSCRSVKKNETKIAEIENSSNSENSSLKTKQEENLQEEKKVVVDDKTKTTTKTTTTRPIDNTKPSSITTPDGKKTILDNAEVVETEISQENNVNSSDYSNSSLFRYGDLYQELNKATFSNSEKSTSNLSVDKKQWNPWQLSWLLVLIPAYLLWKNRSLIKRPWWV